MNSEQITENTLLDVIEPYAPFVGFLIIALLFIAVWIIKRRLKKSKDDTPEDDDYLDRMR